MKKIIVHYGEIGLKGKNQPNFRKKLKENIEAKLTSRGVPCSVTEVRGYLSLTLSAAQEPLLPAILATLGEVFGVVWFAPVDQVAVAELDLKSPTLDIQPLKKRISQIAQARYQPGKTFCVRAKRANKDFPLTSLDLERQLGEAIFDNTDWQQVNLEHPDCTFYLEVGANTISLFSEKIKGPGGLPVGTSGRVLALLSGGIDSPVAAYLAARRGCQVDFIHFTATAPQQQAAEEYKISQLVQILSNYTLRSKLYLFPYIYFDMAMFDQHADYELIIFRRFMARVAERLAQQLGAQALITGDNLAQVASQTLANLVTTTQAVTMPILRPLLTYDKQEIVDLAKTIGSYERSIEFYKDCCAIVSRFPKTLSDHATLTALEQQVLPDYEGLIQQTLTDVVSLEYEYGRQVG